MFCNLLQKWHPPQPDNEEQNLARILLPSPESVPEDKDCQPANADIITIATGLYKQFEIEDPDAPDATSPFEQIAVIKWDLPNPSGTMTMVVTPGQDIMNYLYHGTITLDGVTQKASYLKGYQNALGIRYESGTFSIGKDTFEGDQALIKCMELAQKISPSNPGMTNIGNYNTTKEGYKLLGTKIDITEGDTIMDIKISDENNWIQYGYKEVPTGIEMVKQYEYLIVNGDFYNKATFDEVKKQATLPVSP